MAEVDRHQNIVFREDAPIEIEVYSDFEDGQSGAIGGVDERAARRIPTSAIEPGAFAGEIGEGLAAEAPSEHQAARP